MKPNFALDLSHDGIGLLHRGRKGWLRVGDVALDDPVMRGALAMLRRTAADLSPEGVTTKLVLPASQILYLEVEAPGPSDTDRDAQVRAALEGRTPYEVSDLVYDHSGSGSTRQVAVVARETLDEAEAFAVEHRFNPVSFVARPADGEYDGEPFFGQTRHARSLLKGETVEPDGEAVAVRGTVSLPERPAPTPAPPPAEAGVQKVAEPDRGDTQAGGADRDARSESEPSEKTAGSAPTDGKPAQNAAPASGDAPGADTESVPSNARSGSGDGAVADDATASSSPQDKNKTPASASGGAAATAATTEGGDAPSEADAPGDSASFTTRRTSGAVTPGVRPSLGRAARFSMGAPALGGAAPAGTGDTPTDSGAPSGEAPQLRADSPKASPSRPAPEVAPLPDPPAPGPRAAHRGFSAKWSGGSTADAAAMQADAPGGDHQTRVHQTAKTQEGGAGDPVNPLPVPVATFPRRSGIMLTLLLLLALASIAVISTLMAQDDLLGALDDPKAQTAEATFLPPLGFDEPPLTAFRPTPRPADRVASAGDDRSNPLLTQDPSGAGSDMALVGGEATGTGPVSAGSIASAGPIETADRAARPAEPVAGVPDTTPSAGTQVVDAANATVDLTAAQAPSPSIQAGDQPLATGALVEDKVGRAAFSAPELGNLQPEDAAEVADELLALVAPDESRRPARRPSPAQRAPADSDTDTGTGTNTDAEATNSPDPALHYAATGVWIAPPPVPETPATGAAASPDAPRAALADPAVRQTEAVVLPAALTSDDQRLATRPVPADPSAKFALDSRGLVRATPDGTLTPGGVLVYAGRPDPAPMPRPGSQVALAATDTDADVASPDASAATTVAETVAETTAETDAEAPDEPEPVKTAANTALDSAPDATTDAAPDAGLVRAAASIAVRSARRPEPRPDNLTDQETPQRLAGLTADDPAQTRAALRPDPVRPSGDKPDSGSLTKTDAAEFVPDDTPEAIKGATKLAIESSGKPHGRPPEMASLIRKARAAQMKNVATPDPNAAPRIPKNTSVAREATEKNLLDLSKISLIGVYGSSSNRRALVRLPSGRFTKVEVGDRMDGGRVLAIGDETLRYTKRGRNLVLSMPRG